ncbi:hypothetical protein [Streptomyces sp. NPDC002602]|uniref:hypothetical protein n=1 Tax=Streptomyces sp. NPDC002602 TaxID=3364654 RepID=UPI0036CFD82F
MTGGETSEAGQRLERLQGLLTGTRSDSRAGRNLARVPKANVMFGALLHAADRLRQGEELTDLEEALLSSLRGALGDAEVKEWGRVYRESVTARGSLTGVPMVITGRSVSQGYAFEDLEGDLPAVTAEWRAQSNWSAVDHKALAAGEDFDSPEFIEGMREWGWAVTVPAWAAAGGQTPEAQAPLQVDGVAAAYRFRLEYENFHVHRQVGDGWPSTGDEIRWISAGQSDLGARAMPFLSDEFGGRSAEAGQTTPFSSPDPRKRVAFDAAAENGLVLNVACWEWDTGDGNLDSVGEALIRLNNDPIFGPIWAAAGAAAPTLLGLLMDLSSLAVTIISYIVSNDLSSSRSLYLDRRALAALSQSGSARWHFNGDGHHELRVKFTGDLVPFPSGTLEYAVRTGTTWGAPTALPWPSTAAPALAVHEGRLYAAFVRPEDHGVMWASMDAGGIWSTPARIGGDQSYVAPALTSAHGKLIYAVTGRNRTIYTRTYTPAAGWTEPAALDGSTQYSPTLATFAGRAWLACTGGNSNIHHRISGNASVNNQILWNPWRTDNLAWKTATAVAMAPGKADGHPRMWRVITATNDHVHSSVNGGADGTGIWQDRGAAPNWRVSHAPALAANEATGALTILMRGTSGPLWVADHNGSSWQEARTVPGANPKDAPAAAYFNNKLYTMYLR